MTRDRLRGKIIQAGQATHRNYVLMRYYFISPTAPPRPSGGGGGSSSSSSSSSSEASGGGAGEGSGEAPQFTTTQRDETPARVTVNVKPLDEEKALEAGADIIAESIVLCIMFILVTIGVIIRLRKARQAQRKIDGWRDEVDRRLEELEERILLVHHVQQEEISQHHKEKEEKLRQQQQGKNGAVVVNSFSSFFSKPPFR
uniref:Uncharacterized protein n=1 Tax=Chromera velia CCMP2878 TaxID=1169474 RepID=A0A0G4I4F4_9ALVE|eukprot:Cvel_1793.t1-p1 / transcript=Cvel_1793.t1 / gene=Cvel_1793 / organism=Chromera_velia_CCMP2878 / gene_product=hypothetical protein / transcript_product=hypothetical protein / location=Cvel_scaffold66:37387-39156(+) / protein_length=199 / sequence_SO=supercontig / SO=protein_coding / is_pseudo=false